MLEDVSSIVVLDGVVWFEYSVSLLLDVDLFVVDLFVVLLLDELLVIVLLLDGVSEISVFDSDDVSVWFDRVDDDVVDVVDVVECCELCDGSDNSVCVDPFVVDGWLVDDWLIGIDLITNDFWLVNDAVVVNNNEIVNKAIGLMIGGDKSLGSFFTTKIILSCFYILLYHNL